MSFLSQEKHRAKVIQNFIINYMRDKISNPGFELTFLILETFHVTILGKWGKNVNETIFNL